MSARQVVRIDVSQRTYDRIKNGFQPFLILPIAKGVNGGDTLWIYKNKGGAQKISCFVLGECGYCRQKGETEGMQEGYMIVTLKGVREVEG
ncbi:MAG: hypothetical protein KBS60_01335 [Phascolarctobacterium sp.]|nr:hypothetical protein [Candidatus Phascolarctobacterium caballi]